MAAGPEGAHRGGMPSRPRRATSLPSPDAARVVVSGPGRDGGGWLGPISAICLGLLGGIVSAVVATPVVAVGAAALRYVRFERSSLTVRPARDGSHSA